MVKGSSTPPKIVQQRRNVPLHNRSLVEITGALCDQYISNEGTQHEFLTTIIGSPGALACFKRLRELMAPETAEWLAPDNGEPNWKLRKCRALATELRSLLEEVQSDLGGVTAFDDEVEDMAAKAGEVEEWLDGLEINVDGTSAAQQQDGLDPFRPDESSHYTFAQHPDDKE